MTPIVFTSLLFFLIVDLTDTPIEAVIAGAFIALMVSGGALLDQWLERKTTR